MATYVSNGVDTGGSGPYVSGTQGVQYLITSIASAGDIIVIPNGSFTWSTGITCSKGLKIMGQTIGGVTITSQSNSALVVLTPPSSSSQVLEFCNLNFICGSSVTGSTGHFVAVNYVSFPVTNGPVAIHDCSFSTPGTGQVLNSMVLVSQNGTVIYSCTFNTNSVMNPSTGQGSAGDECIQFKNPGTDIWQFVDTMGLSGDPNGTQNTYVEDCHFLNNLTETLDFDDGSRTAVRSCTFTLAAIASHGYDTSPFGGRHWELYNNNFVGDSGTTNLPNGWITMRSGTGVIANNTFGSISGSNWGTKSDIAWLSDGACQAKAGHCFTTIPIPRAIGQGWSGGGGSYSYPQATSLGTGYIEDPAYIFGNTTGSGNTLWTWNGAVDCANQISLGFDSSHYIVQNTDFFVGTAKSGWSGYTYPHPLRATLAGSGSSTYRPDPTCLSSSIMSVNGNIIRPVKRGIVYQLR